MGNVLLIILVLNLFLVVMSEIKVISLDYMVSLEERYSEQHFN